MNILFIKHFFVGFMVLRYRECPYSVTFPYIQLVYKIYKYVYILRSSIYIYIYMLCVYVCVCACVCSHVSMCAYIYIYVCVCVCRCVCVCELIYFNKSKYCLIFRHFLARSIIWEKLVCSFYIKNIFLNCIFLKHYIF